MSALQLSVNTSAGRSVEIAQFAAAGRVQVPGILTQEAATALHDVIAHFQTWTAVYDRDGQNATLNDAALDFLTDIQKTALLGHLSKTAATGFQYFFSNIPLYDIYYSGGEIDPALKTIFEFLNSDGFLATCRTLTGLDDISFADGQVTRYGPGHFLTRHDDNIAGKNRLAAYVLNLTPTWRAEWGGALEFYDEAGNIERGFTPTFNALNLFRVPQTHAVTYVTPFARTYRYAITGWLRSGDDPKGS